MPHVRLATALLTLVVFLIAAGPAVSQPQEILVAPPGSGIPGAIVDLDSLFNAIPQGAVVTFSPGTYSLDPKPYLEDTCGNCPEESTAVRATVGLTISGQGIFLVGPKEDEGEAVIRTNAGYGILFEDCRSCSMERLTVTGGTRDPAPEATDAAIVAKRSSVNISSCVIRDNIGDSTTVAATVVGIIGVAGREGSLLTLRDNRIVRNSWDGVALYRECQAVIEDNWIDGVDLARGTQIGGGRGVGIGMTWNAFATVRGNVVRNYWKGIGVFVDAQATVEENIVENVATWGVTLWDADVGRPSGTFRRNVIYRTGACGASIVRTSAEMPRPGQFVQNILIATGQDRRYDSGEPYCYQTAIAKHAVPDNFSISANIAYLNREPRRRGGVEDVGRDVFEQRMIPVWQALARWDKLRETEFWKKYYEEAAP